MIPVSIAVRLSPEAREALGRHTGEGYSQAVMLAIRAYDALCVRDRPDWTPAQWRTVCDACDADGVTIDSWPRGRNALVSALLGGDQKMQTRCLRLTFGGALAVLSVVGRRQARRAPAVAARVRMVGGEPDAVPGEDGWRE